MMTELKKTLDEVNNLQMTENSGVGYKSTYNDLVDLNYQLPSMRNDVSTDMIVKFERALRENFDYTIKWLFFARDIRGGVGERSSFIKLYEVFFENYPNEATKLLSLVAEFGRWKDVVELAFAGNDMLKDACLNLIDNQLRIDVTNFTRGESVSLLAKWLPSINASVKARRQAIDIIKKLNMSNGSYRKLLSKLRNYIDVTERKTCSNNWGGIDYNKVSSNANLRYSDAFMKHDSVRRAKYLEDLKNPTSGAKMNAGTLTPPEIWSKYTSGAGYHAEYLKYDESLEQMWKNLTEQGETGNTLVVVDGSGSMGCRIGSGSIEALDVSRSLGVYFAERCVGEFHNKMIEFSSNPHYIDLDGCDSLYDKIKEMSRHDDCSNTNIEKVFDLILKTAIDNNINQDELPERIVIISDMEFDSVAHRGYYWDTPTVTPALFDEIKKRYEAHGYKMPRLVFWNVNSRTNTIPMTENEMGVCLVSGFSTNVLKLVMSNESDPWSILKEALDSPRYQVIDEKLNEVEHDS